MGMFEQQAQAARFHPRARIGGPSDAQAEALTLSAVEEQTFYEALAGSTSEEYVEGRTGPPTVAEAQREAQAQAAASAHIKAWLRVHAQVPKDALVTAGTLAREGPEVAESVLSAAEEQALYEALMAEEEYLGGEVSEAEAQQDGDTADNGRDLTPATKLTRDQQYQDLDFLEYGLSEAEAQRLHKAASAGDQAHTAAQALVKLAKIAAMSQQDGDTADSDTGDQPYQDFEYLEYGLSEAESQRLHDSANALKAQGPAADYDHDWQDYEYWLDNEYLTNAEWRQEQQEMMVEWLQQGPGSEEQPENDEESKADVVNLSSDGQRTKEMSQRLDDVEYLITLDWREEQEMLLKIEHQKLPQKDGSKQMSQREEQEMMREIEQQWLQLENGYDEQSVNEQHVNNLPSDAQRTEQISPRPAVSGKGGNFSRVAALIKSHGMSVDQFVGALSADLIEQQGAGTDEEIFKQRLLQYLWDPVLESLRQEVQLF